MQQDIAGTTPTHADLTPIDRFLADWKAQMMKSVPELYMEFCRKESEIFHDGSLDGWERGRARKRLRAAYGRTVVERGYDALHRSERFAAFLDEECARKKEALIARASRKIGGIDSVEWLRIGMTGELEGYVSGPQGSLHLHSILAGGYNIQCLHIRFLMNKVK